MRPSPTFRREVDGLLQPCGRMAPLFLAFAVIATFFGDGGSLLVGAVVMLLTGVLCGVLLLLSWRLYHPMFSWLLWVLPGAAVFAMAAMYAVLPRAYSGEISVLRAIYLLVGCSGLGFFGLLFLLRGSVRRWLGIR
jgi:small-conductance mechanosensitive channel